jgi:hypothetical protein
MSSENKFMVGRRFHCEGQIMICGPLPMAMTADEALNLAAWLAAIADPGSDRPGSAFQNLLAEVVRS